MIRGVIHGQILISEAGAAIATEENGARALVISPANSMLQILLPLSPEACKTLGEALLAPHVARPTPSDIEVVRRNGKQ